MPASIKFMIATLRLVPSQLVVCCVSFRYHRTWLTPLTLVFLGFLLTHLLVATCNINLSASCTNYITLILHH